jgi:hypothetical protein
MTDSWDDDSNRCSSAVSLSLCLFACTLAALLGGCGQAKHPTACLPQARAAMARFLAIPTGHIVGKSSIANNGMPQCAFGADLIGATRVVVVANIDSAPQAFFRLERTAVEAAQNFTSPRVVAPPQRIGGLGLDADWFPASQQLMTSDGDRLISISVSWRDASPARKRALAEVVARPYLGRLNYRAAG